MAWNYDWRDWEPLDRAPDIREVEFSWVKSDDHLRESHGLVLHSFSASYHGKEIWRYCAWESRIEWELSNLHEQFAREYSRFMVERIRRSYEDAILSAIEPPFK